MNLTVHGSNPSRPTSLATNYRRLRGFETVPDFVDENLGNGLYLLVLPFLWHRVDSMGSTINEQRRKMELIVNGGARVWR